MFFIMAFKITLTTKSPQVFKFQSSRIRVGKYYGSIKIDEIAVIRGVALAETDTVWVVTC